MKKIDIEKVKKLIVFLVTRIQTEEKLSWKKYEEYEKYWLDMLEKFSIEE